ncbi:MAG: STAS domain-containing protein [Spirochaetia bacterium]|jgi:anti-anti-sigma factor
MNNDIVPAFDDEKNKDVSLRLQKLEQVEGGLLVYVTGYVDLYNSDFFRRCLGKIIEAGFVKLVIDMSKTNYISSTAVGAFVNLLKIVKPLNGDVVLQQIQPKPYEVLELLGFSQFFIIKENLNESVDYLVGHLEPPQFPRVFACPVCSKRLKASKAGRFRCSECKTILTIDEATRVKLG